MNALSSLFKFVSNPKVMKVIAIVAIIFIVIWVFTRGSSKASKWVRNNLAPVQGDNINAPISQLRQKTLESMAQDVYNAIYGFSTGTAGTLDTINSLNDSEFLYVVNYYEKYLSDNKLYYDIDWEFLPATDADDNVMNRLQTMNLA